MSRVFDANTANYLSALTNTAYDLTYGNAMTIAAWVKRASTGANQYILARSIAADADVLFGFRCRDTDVLRWYESLGYAGYSNSTITDTTTWHHVAFTYNGTSTLTFYLDGSNAGSNTDTTLTTGATSSEILTIGVAKSGGLAMNGKLAYVALWNTALSGANITSLQTSATPESIGSGCVGSWHLDTSSLSDSSVTANAMVVSGTVNFDSDNPSFGLTAAQEEPAWLELMESGGMVGQRWR